LAPNRKYQVRNQVKRLKMAPALDITKKFSLVTNMQLLAKRPMFLQCKNQCCTRNKSNSLLKSYSNLTSFRSILLGMAKKILWIIPSKNLLKLKMWACKFPRRGPNQDTEEKTRARLVWYRDFLETFRPVLTTQWTGWAQSFWFVSLKPRRILILALQVNNSRKSLK